MEIPLWILLIPLALVLLFTFFFLLFNIFHLAKYGIVGRGATALIFVYCVSYGFIFVIGISALLTISWTDTVPLRSLVPFSANSTSSLNI